ncbi:hypothetical protein PORCRE_1568 [Porphyromonas crevioricanis JCM 15906]|uniref:Uncharacterized protein n=1 Tax=Porphyromonas crevioricanis JCM 15906 TaxID=1305617 RepID=T1DTJ7_9PORP|nr:hypothetical protein PORCRE_1568 [Porphyromonas crevioricanis JCM 15906]GAD07992.1 hypothetical protein PORCAN_1622 [Porphyromonas crevioricanis JCM 13913]
MFCKIFLSVKTRKTEEKEAVETSKYTSLLWAFIHPPEHR